MSSVTIRFGPCPAVASARRRPTPPNAASPATRARPAASAPLSCSSRLLDVLLSGNIPPLLCMALADAHHGQLDIAIDLIQKRQ
jgi:hypothetical protein